MTKADKRRFGYSRDKRSDCVQVVIALVVTPEGFPLAYEVMAGNTADKTTLRDFLRQDRRAIRQGPAHLGDGPRHSHRGGAGRDARDRAAGALSGRHAQGAAEQARAGAAREPVAGVRQGVEVKLLPEEQELYVFARSAQRVHKERAMRRRKLKWLWERLKQLSAMELEREAIAHEAGRRARQGAGCVAPRSMSRWRRTAPHSPMRSIAASCARSDGAKADISCAAICAAASRPMISLRPLSRDGMREQGEQGGTPLGARSDPAFISRLVGMGASNLPGARHQ